MEIKFHGAINVACKTCKCTHQLTRIISAIDRFNLRSVFAPHSMYTFFVFTERVLGSFFSYKCLFVAQAVRCYWMKDDQIVRISTNFAEILLLKKKIGCLLRLDVKKRWFLGIVCFCICFFFARLLLIYVGWMFCFIDCFHCLELPLDDQTSENECCVCVCVGRKAWGMLLCNSYQFGTKWAIEMS